MCSSRHMFYSAVPGAKRVPKGRYSEPSILKTRGRNEELRRRFVNRHSQCVKQSSRSFDCRKSPAAGRDRIGIELAEDLPYADCACFGKEKLR